MSQTTLIDKIKADAAIDVQKIKESGQAELEAIQRETEKALEEKRAIYSAVQQKRLAHYELVSLSRARQVSKISLQKAKRTGIDGLFSNVERQLIELPTEEYIQMYKRWMSEILPTEIDVTTVLTPKNRIEETKQILSERKIDCEFITDPSVTAGFILHTTDGVYDITLSRLMNEQRTALEMEVMQKISS